MYALPPCVPAALSPQVTPSATESCFARQHNVSDNNNQCFSGANGHLPSQLIAQRPGAIDNQPLVNTDPMKARMCVCLCGCVGVWVKAGDGLMLGYLLEEESKSVVMNRAAGLIKMLS